MSAARLLAAVLAVCVAVLLGPAAAAAPATPEPERPDETSVPGPVVVDGVPEAVAAWFRTQARDVVSVQAGAELGLDAAQREDLTLGVVRPVMWWSPALLAGTELDPAAVPTERWTAPLELDGAGVGVVFAEATSDGADMQTTLSDDQVLADALLALAPEAPAVHDVPLDAWFTVLDGEVRPLDEAARESLAGSAPLEVYQPFLAERYAEADTTEPGSAVPEEPGPSWSPAAWAAVVLVLLLVWAAVVVWLRRPENGEPEPPAGPRRAPPRRPSRGARR
ncbi:hypothetical protein [Georgenia subflava]|uniref:Uncharacterized protein n=1 Tax=Georgenia subflava TaxID=1622177 RepID=A0A6N7ENQ2_9MICO|nr:hypothetical protein [Georgenia subflava]MPV39091.1 hypothetical protein [Georgenia subflava]